MNPNDRFADDDAGCISYGPLKLDPYSDPLRKDPRYEKLLAELAPKD
jgi:hypothetical protein